jgi:predicted MFS family arabinose efflux permease
MSAPPEAPQQSHDERVPPHVALVRIGTVIAMSTAAAFGIFLMIGGWLLEGFLIALLAVPFFVVMRLVEGPPREKEEPPS